MRIRWLSCASVATLMVGLMVCLSAMLTAQRGTDVPMTNADAIKMVEAKLHFTIIVNAIASSPRNNFDVSAPALVALKQAGVPDAVIVAMQRSAAGERPPQFSRLPDAAQPSGPVAPPPAASRAPGAAGPFRTPATEPSSRQVLCLIDPASGALTPLEPAKWKEQKVGSSRVNYYYPGAAATTRFRVGAPFGFAIRLPSNITRVSAYATRLIVESDRRYIAKATDGSSIHFDVRNLGQAVSPLPGNKNDPPDALYEITPQATLGAGEYDFFVNWVGRGIGYIHSERWTIGFGER